jgi:hypothetical protein
MAAPTSEQKATWPQPNYENPENLHGLIIGLTVPTLVLAVVCEYTVLEFRHAVAIGQFWTPEQRYLEWHEMERLFSTTVL